MFILFQGELNSMGGTTSILQIDSNEDVVNKTLYFCLEVHNKDITSKILGFEVYDAMLNKSKTYTRNKERKFDKDLYTEVYRVVKHHHLSYPVI